ncbi:hypothetical protein [Chloroflexus sp.]|uniref:NADH-quinone oxidoreductase subunit D-related protein n=1 Tax=Chloroflexus sp. TaxID=1904827 RepID=UPI002ADDFB53|nr:hypothetical protein [Chloroflexus sp.]
MKYQLTLHPVAGAWHSERLTLTIEGEYIVDVEYRPSVGDGAYARRLTQGGITGALQAARQVCPHCQVAHTLAFSLAIEQLAGVTAPLRAQAVRVVLAELERAASHINTLAALATALGLTDAARLSRLTTRLGLIALKLSGNDEAALIRPGGLLADPSESALAETAQAINDLLPRMIAVAEQSIPRRSILARTVDVGVLQPTAARQFGLAGPLARASGIATDVRIQEPSYAAYNILAPALVTEEGGDVHARAVVLLLEAIESLRLVVRWLQNLPVGNVYEEVPLVAGEATVTVEAPRGSLRYTVRSDGQRLTEVEIGIAPQLDRLLARSLLQQAVVDDVMLIAISTDPCTACWQSATYLIGRS